MSWPARVLGVLTALYSVAVLVRPAILTGPTGLVPRGTAPTGGVAILSRAVAARDTAVGLAMVFAPTGAPLVWALLVRIASDVGDATVFGLSDLDRTARLKTIGVALGWGVLNLVALLVL